MANGVLTIPLSGVSFPASHTAATRAERLAEFVAGPENALAVTAIEPLLEAAPSGFNPLLLCGPHGSGKSHLAYGLAEWWRRNRPETAVECFSGSEFARQHTESMGISRLETWRAQLRGAELFILDDLGELTDKRPAQQELLHTLDALADNEALVVITARSFPGHWPALLTGLRSRLSAGLAVPLSYPAPEARRVILEQLAAARGVTLPAATLDDLAAALGGSVPTLLSALLELELEASVSGRAVDSKRVKRLVAQRKDTVQPTLREIAGLTARYFGLKVADLKSPARRRALVAARGVAMYLARRLTTNSLGQIGKYFGGRDHTTVLYGCRRTEKLLHRDRAIRQAVTELSQRLASS